MADFARHNRGLENTFPPSGLNKHEPANLSDTVQLVHPVFGPLVRIGQRERIFGFQSFVNTGIHLIDSPTVERTVRMIEYAHVSHDSATARHLNWGVANNNFAGTGVSIDSTRQHGAGSVYALGEIYTLMKTVALGPGDQFFVQPLGAADAAMNVDVFFCFTDYASADQAHAL